MSCEDGASCVAEVRKMLRTGVDIGRSSLS